MIKKSSKSTNNVDNKLSVDSFQHHNCLAAAEKQSSSQLTLYKFKQTHCHNKVRSRPDKAPAVYRAPET